MSFTRLVVRLIYCYRWMISPLFPPSCRYEPTCSRYAIHAIECHGLAKGVWMTFKRLTRCHPFEKLGGSWGSDPVPQPANSQNLSSKTKKTHF